MQLCLDLAVSLLLALAGMTMVPWLLAVLYGNGYAGAGTTIALGLATAVAHMGNAPAAARLTIVSLRATAVINTIWAVFVAVAATLLLVRGGSAWQAMARVLSGAHVLSALAGSAGTLRQKDNLPRGHDSPVCHGGYGACPGTGFGVGHAAQHRLPAVVAASTGAGCCHLCC